MTKANKSGSFLEDQIYDILKTYGDICITKQFPLNDVFGTGKVDFKVEYRNKSFFFEAKNQIVCGSVDQKLPFYLENIRENKYPGHFALIINGNGVRNGALSYLKRKQKELNFSIIDFDDIKHQLDKLLNYDEIQTIKLKLSPVIKWAGGKRMIMDSIIKFFPKKIEGDYYEPFCGGFSVACELYNTCKFSDKTMIYINDTIPQLISLYRVIKQDPYPLIEELKKPNYLSNKTNFELNKARYNSDEYKEEIEIAALFLFLNKTGYNGLYRVNKDGKYNVPFAKRENVKLYDEENINAMHHFFKRCVITCLDYKEILYNVKKGDMVYCDPPYYDTFNSYSKTKFPESEQLNLFSTCSSLKQYSTVFVSNSDCSFINNLYSSCVINKIPVKRVVNSNAKDRSIIIYELFITF